MFTCEFCGGEIEPENLALITGQMRLPGNIFIPVALDYHDSCLPAPFFALAAEKMRDLHAKEE